MERELQVIESMFEDETTLHTREVAAEFSRLGVCSPRRSFRHARHVLGCMRADGLIYRYRVVPLDGLPARREWAWTLGALSVPTIDLVQYDIHMEFELLSVEARDHVFNVFRLEPEQVSPVRGSSLPLSASNNSGGRNGEDE